MNHNNVRNLASSIYLITYMLHVIYYSIGSIAGRTLHLLDKSLLCLIPYPISALLTKSLLEPYGDQT